ncbi:hypothetical protein [Dactylosporangium sp. NPDC000521]|uniref:hypothetical protein n=1 Tax=Dactylosporangium sp. NPDC000521 TaxID=3363975 RepID=UPI0036AFA7E9
MRPTGESSLADVWGEDYAGVPEMLASAASASADDTRAAWQRIFERLFDVNRYYPALYRLAPVIPAAVPHFVALACSAPHERATALSAAGRAADPERSFRASPEARSALRALAATIAPLLDDPEAAVRAAAAYALAQADADPGLLRHRLVSETDPGVRAALLLGLGAEAVDTLTADHTADGTVVVAAALACARAGVPWPDGAPATVAAAVASGAEVPADWLRRESTLADLLCAVDGEVGAVLLDALPVTVPVLRAVEDCCRWHRPARIWSASWAGRLLLDDDPLLRAAAVDAVAATGTAAAPWADDLARVAASGETPPDAREKAIWVLGSLGDQRWVELGGWTAGGWPDLTAAQFDAIRAELERATAAGDAEGVTTLVRRLRPLGARASALTSQVRAARALAPGQVAWALARLDAAETADLPALRALATEGWAEPAFAAWRLTHDRSVVVEAIRHAIEELWGPQVPLALTMAADAGLELPELLPTLREWQRPVHAPTWIYRMQLAAARHLLASTGDGRHPPDEILATVRAIVDSGGQPAAQAATLAADLGWTELIDDLRAAFGRHLTSGRPAIAESLWRLGVPAHDLAPALLDTVEDGLWSAEAAQALVTIGATTAAPQLARLADRARSVAYNSGPHTMAWRDEQLRADLRAAAATLRGMSDQQLTGT